MYSPHSDIYKMWKSPNYISFRVLINDKEYYGRPGDLKMKHPYEDTVVSCKFPAFTSLNQYLSGSMPKEEFLITPPDIIGLEAIDTLSQKYPSPLSLILKICHEFNEAIKRQDINPYPLIPQILTKLLDAIEEYGMEHPKAYIKIPIEIISELQVEIENRNYDLSLEEIKEKVSYNVSLIFEYGE